MADLLRDKLRVALQRIAPATTAPGYEMKEIPFLDIQAAKLRGMWKNQPIPECDVTAAYWAD